MSKFKAFVIAYPDLIGAFLGSAIGTALGIYLGLRAGGVI